MGRSQNFLRNLAGLLGDVFVLFTKKIEKAFLLHKGVFFFNPRRRTKNRSVEEFLTMNKTQTEIVLMRESSIVVLRTHVIQERHRKKPF
jgi:hypothetical protein